MNFGFSSLTIVSVRRPYQKKLSDSKMNSDVPNHQRDFRSRLVSPSTRLIVRYDMPSIVRPGAKRVQVQWEGRKERGAARNSLFYSLPGVLWVGSLLPAS